MQSTASALRVLLYSPYSLRFGGGGERWAVEVVRRAHALSFDIVTTDYVGKNKPGTTKEAILSELAGCPVMEAHARVVHPGLMVPSPQLVELLKERAERADCIVFNNVFPGQEVLMMLVKKSSGLPVLSVYQAPLVNPSLLTAIYRRLFHYRVVKRFEAHQVLNKSDGMTLREAGCRGVFVIPNGVDTAFFSPVPNGRALDRFVVLFAGRLNYHKGFDLLLEAASDLLQKDRPWIEVWVAGSGPMDSQAAAGARHIPGLRLLGQLNREQLRAIYRQATIALFPSRWEGSPMVGLEAIASGLPLVASDIPGFDGICVNGVNGLRVNANSGAAGFAKAVETLLLLWSQEPRRFNSLGRASREIAVKDFDWSVIIPQIERILLGLCNSTHASSG